MKDESFSGTTTSHHFITETNLARPSLESMQAELVVGIDTETYWDAASRTTCLSLAQVATAAGAVVVIDALAAGAEVLRPLVESPSVRKVAHNARFDAMVLRGAGLSPASLVDTLRMAQMALSLPSYSLAAVVEHLFGTPLDKTLQRSNWRRRPLTAKQIAYAATDARATLRVYEELSRRLEAEGRFEEVLKASTIVVRSGDDASRSTPRRRRRIAPAPNLPLTPQEQRIVAHLKRWRLARANEQRRPAYMICPDRTLEQLARERPDTVEALFSVHGLGERKIENFGAALLETLKECAKQTGGEDGKIEE